MKTFLTVTLMLSLACIGKLNAQCSIAQSSVIVNVQSVTTDVTGCTTTFDLTFDLAGNGGNKWSHIHFWDAVAYPGVNYGTGTGPDLSALNGGAGNPKPVLSTVSLDYHLGTNVISSSYPPDGNVTVQTTGMTYTRTAVGSNTRFTINNIVVHTNNCSPLNLNADVWSAQDNNGKIVGCSVSGISVQADEPVLRGLMQCNNPRTFTLSVQTKQARTVTYTAFKDVAPFGIFDANDQLPANVVLSPTMVNNPATSMANPFTTYGPIAYTGGSAPGNQFSVWVVAQAFGVNNSNGILIENTCSPLPVIFESFSVSKTNQNIVLNWQTSKEENNAGFYVEKKTVDADWRSIGFVATGTATGFSNEKLSYKYTDNNTSKGIIQYRLRQVDLDGKFKYSDVKAIKTDNENNSEISLFPNPSKGGNFSVLFSDNLSYNLQVIDANGRIVDQYMNVRNSKAISGLKPGQYLVIAVSKETGVRTAQKIIVQ
jgi:hypothetical protein